jgi:asparagine N-glycosylation enzyme membrane subunit Stt3
MVIRFPATKDGQIVFSVIKKVNIRQQNVMVVDLVMVRVFLRLIIVIIDRGLRRQRLHTYLLALIFVVLVLSRSGQQLRLVLAYSRMLLLTNGQKIWMILYQKTHHRAQKHQPLHQDLWFFS